MRIAHRVSKHKFASIFPNNPMTSIMPSLRFIPENQEFDTIIERFRLEPIIVSYNKGEDYIRMREAFLSGNLKLSPVISPRLFSLLDEVREVLGFESPVDMFVESSMLIRALTAKSSGESPSAIVVSSGLIESATDNELRFVMGHELAALEFDYHKLRLMEYAAGVDDDGDSMLHPLIGRKITIWKRMAHLSADRAGYLAAKGDMKAIISIIFKSLSGLDPALLQFNTSEFQAQVKGIDSENVDELGFSDPLVPIRIRALQLLDEAGGMTRDLKEDEKLEEKMVEMLQWMGPTLTTPVGVHFRNILLYGGLLVTHTGSAEISAAENDFLVRHLLPLTDDPEVEIAKVTRTQAQEALAESTSWMKENGGEDVFLAFQLLTGVASADGAVHAEREALLLSIAETMGIPQAAARDRIYESIGFFVQSRQSK